MLLLAIFLALRFRSSAMLVDILFPLVEISKSLLVYLEPSMATLLLGFILETSPVRRIASNGFGQGIIQGAMFLDSLESLKSCKREIVCFGCFTVFTNSHTNSAVKKHQNAYFRVRLTDLESGFPLQNQVPWVHQGPCQKVPL